jgi:hypothetical protein
MIARSIFVALFVIFILHCTAAPAQEQQPKKLDILGIRTGMTVIEFMSSMRARGFKGTTCPTFDYTTVNPVVTTISCSTSSPNAETLSITATKCIGKWVTPPSGVETADPLDPPIITSVQYSYWSAIPTEEMVDSV